MCIPPSESTFPLPKLNVPFLYRGSGVAIMVASCNAPIAEASPTATGTGTVLLFNAFIIPLAIPIKAENIAACFYAA